jgi:hypothetical protein
VNSLFHPGHRIGVCTAFPDRLAASDALAGQDVVLRRNAARFPASFQALARGCLWVTGEKARSDAHRVHPMPQPPDG